MNDRTQTPQKQTARQHFVTTPSNKSGRLQPKSFGAAKKNSSTERKVDKSDSKLSTPGQSKINARLNSQRSPVNEPKVVENKVSKFDSKVVSDK